MIVHRELQAFFNDFSKWFFFPVGFGSFLLKKFEFFNFIDIG